MKPVKIVIAVCCALTLTALFAACKKNEPPVPGPPDPSAEEYSAASRIQTELKDALREIEEIRNDTGKVIRTVKNLQGFETVLNNGEKRPIRFVSSAETGTLTLPEGNYTVREIEFDLPNAAIEGSVELGTVRLTAVGEGGCTFKGHVGTLLASGGDMKIVLYGGADRVYVTGADTELVLQDGEYAVLYCDNISSVITNRTDTAVTLILPNGTGIEIPKNKSYRLGDGKLKTVW